MSRDIPQVFLRVFIARTGTILPLRKWSVKTKLVSTFSGKCLLRGFCEDRNGCSGSKYAVNSLRNNRHLFKQYRAALAYLFFRLFN